MDQQVIKDSLEQLKSIAEGVNNPWTIIVSLLGVGVALLLGVLGIYQDWLRALFRKPQLEVSIRVEPPDCHKVAIREINSGRFICDCYYFRFRVTNTGNQQMEDAEGMVTEVFRNSNGTYRKIENFLPLNLKWSHYGFTTIPTIQPRLFKHLDFGHIVESQFAALDHFGISERPNIVFQFDLAVIPNTGSHILLPGDYKVRVIFAANNLRPKEKLYHLTIKDIWTNNENEMLQSILLEEKAL